MNCVHSEAPLSDNPCRACWLSPVQYTNWAPRQAEESSLQQALANHGTPQKLTGGSSNYYVLPITHPTRGGPAYTAECNDIIEALGMDFAEGNAFKALWRRAAARKGNGKPGTSSLYDAEKVEFFGRRLVIQEKQRAAS